ncbi:MAG: hypothetical protein PHT54_03835 [Candidatus Nanoarchaeia archaeon]|nr:hypothetical protein [Candidatus Nanoarchaeia archaeon]
MSSELGERLPYQIVVFATIAIMVAAVVVVLNLSVNQEIKVDGFKSDLLMKRLFYSSDCFAYEDERVYPGIINFSKFNDERIKECMETTNLVYAKLKNKEASNDILAYKDQLNFCKLKKNCYFEEKYVLVNDKEEIMNFGVIMIE